MAGVMTPGRTDTDIRQDVLDELDWDPYLIGSEIAVTVKDGIVTLSGWTDSYLNRQAAQDAAFRVLGVRAVANEIEVRLPSAAERTDADLARAVLEALRWDAAIPTGGIEVVVRNGRVTLQGVVDGHFQREAAERVVRRLAGVRDVNNHLLVKVHPLPSDVQKRIEQALIRSAEVDARRIQVTLKDTVAVLTGTVRTYAEKRAAERSALAAPGVTAVENHLSIDPLIS
jgi:osmotically-inducible protein OsmY